MLNKDNTSIISGVFLDRSHCLSCLGRLQYNFAGALYKYIKFLLQTSHHYLFILIHLRNTLIMKVAIVLLFIFVRGAMLGAPDVSGE